MRSRYCRQLATFLGPVSLPSMSGEAITYNVAPFIVTVGAYFIWSSGAPERLLGLKVIWVGFKTVLVTVVSTLPTELPVAFANKATDWNSVATTFWKTSEYQTTPAIWATTKQALHDPAVPWGALRSCDEAASRIGAWVVGFAGYVSEGQAAKI